MPEIYSFGIEPITVHAWNKDRTQIAISPSNHQVKIFLKSGATWTLTDTLEEHSQRVTGIDWGQTHDRIVTCGTDRNAYVWTQQQGKWMPALVILRINRAATTVKWSPLENKFAVGSGARLISVCYFDEENDWWVSKQIKKPLRSTVTSLDWHPNNYLLAAGSSDFKARVFSAYIKDVEDKPAGNAWGKKMPFGQLMAEFSNGGGGWVHDVSFSGSGDRICWVGHDASISVVDANNQDVIATIKTNHLPFITCIWVTENSFVAGGHDCCPMLFSFSAPNTITFMSKLDEKNKKNESKGLSAMKHFRNLDSHAQADNVDTGMNTTHKNTVTQVSIHTGDRASVSKFSTTSVDGQLAIWDFKKK